MGSCVLTLDCLGLYLWSLGASLGCLIVRCGFGILCLFRGMLLCVVAVCLLCLFASLVFCVDYFGFICCGGVDTACVLWVLHSGVSFCLGGVLLWLLICLVRVGLLVMVVVGFVGGGWVGDFGGLL